MNVERIVEQYWPYDGPHSPESVEAAAEAITGLVRYMANALWTVRPSGPSLGRVLSRLVLGEHRLDEVLEKLISEAARLAEDPTMYDDRRDQPAAFTVGEIAGHIGNARSAFTAGRTELAAASAAAYHLGHHTPSVSDGG